MKGVEEMRPHRRVTACLMMLLLLGLFGCGEPSENNNNNPQRDLSLTQTTEDGVFTLQYGEFTDQEGKAYTSIPMNEYFEFILTITPKDSTKTLKTPTIAAEMPDHGHGMNTKPVIEDLGDGKYRVKGMLFHMPGWWKLSIKDFSGDGVEREVAFNVEL